MFKDSILLRDQKTYVITTVDNLMSIAIEDPYYLLKVMKSGEMKKSTLSFSAEYIGLCSSNDMIIDYLIELLFHPAATVREGAIYGLYHHRLELKVITAFSEMIKVEINDSIREIVNHEIEYFFEEFEEPVIK
jgi:hypothetical protein